MRKKILDAAVITTFTVCLSITSNIQEVAADAEKFKESSMPSSDFTVQEAEFDAENLFAGAALAISVNSFTTESGEKENIEKKDVVLVTSFEESEKEENQVLEEISEEVEISTQTFEEGQARESLGDSDETESNNRWNISLTEDEVDLLAKIVWLEARGEPVEGQEAVVEVIFNRMASELYPNTLYDVLSQNNPVQFVSWKKRDKAQPTETEYQSIYNVLNGNTDLLRNDTMNFSTYPLTSRLDVKICCHYFCY